MHAGAPRGDTILPLSDTENSGAKGEVGDVAKFPLRQRLAIRAISSLGALIIRIVGPTLRYVVSIEQGGPSQSFIAPAVYCFWHQCIFAGAYFYRDRDVAVITSRSFDGEYIARIIGKLGFRAVRGSSSRGGARALLLLHKEIEAGSTVAFTIDGPRGPRFVAKPGPVLLARNSGVPIVCFHIAAEHAWVLGSWDATIIPRPFSRVYLRLGRMIEVPAHAGEVEMSQAHAEMQASLESVRDTANLFCRSHAGNSVEHRLG